MRLICEGKREQMRSQGPRCEGRDQIIEEKRKKGRTTPHHEGRGSEERNPPSVPIVKKKERDQVCATDPKRRGVQHNIANRCDHGWK